MTLRDFLLWLCLLPGLSIKQRYTVYEYLINIRCTTLTLTELFLITNLSYAKQQCIRTYVNTSEIEAAFQKAQKYQFVTILDEAYPSLLKEITYPPLCLFYVGTLSLCQQMCVALVGARKNDTYGRWLVEKLVPPLIQAKIVTVSGLAYGIDELVHRETLKNSGATIGVIGTGLAVAYPRRYDALQQQIGQQGLIISEYLPWVGPRKHHFPERNRLIAGLCQVCVVIQAQVKSGSLITANIALDENRTVMAVPGACDNRLSQGTNALILAGAEPVLNPQQIIASCQIMS